MRCCTKFECTLSISFLPLARLLSYHIVPDLNEPLQQISEVLIRVQEENKGIAVC